ncbi:MAG TPA: TetR/AcrR family transcriptional regulator [Phenylobacterium sp.]|jgi:AcrR family transcriptional regulator|uniref:TetR/AcrR family transcriptional regulator n=1 Tax=Phenylobacterium sp. TaxID=1871053 RepID=UPI002D2E6A03|nr:TetR/AcrR family transcriptional regulator [Phenylobacterium sp.]HZZ70295.1 TetR/AcrR family transcriptional regulator [Phenylobacterium sp.]
MTQALAKAVKAPRRDREDWVEAARLALIEGGVGKVKVEPLARVLGITTGSFYHHFRKRQDLLDAVLADWETQNSAPLFQAVREAGPDPDAQLDALFDAWLTERDYIPSYDSAVRDWARTSKPAEAAVRRVDAERIDLLKSIFLGFGYDPDRAFIRARITYFHQVGYYAMEIIEDRAVRDRLRPLYREALVGKPPKATKA